ncbi:MAG: GNAT family N-acetyltransferase [Elusimicrobia bacterium]|nr:GNAT family N-acetyltransferase [Elusimicrobiota bacterium]
MTEVRRAGPDDWAQVREICCETGDAGEPIDRERWRFFGEFWVGPYQLLAPAWTFVALREGRVVGYLNGCPASLSFYFRRLLSHRPRLAAAALAGRYGSTVDTRRFLNPWEGVKRNLAVRFGPRLYARLLHRYRAHLHTNVRAGLRGAGVGRAVMESYLGQLRAAGVGGVHLFCGARPVPFYRRLGFHVMARVETGKGPVFAMARRLPKK